MLDNAETPEYPLAELNEIVKLVEQAGDLAQLHIIDTVEFKGEQLPLYVITMGSSSADVPAFGLFGGVHGVERIGTEVVMSYLRSLVASLSWAPDIRRQLENMRLVFMPVVNPAGVLQGSRCNANHVDLMRNAPIDAQEKASFLAGGQRLSRYIPWYRGEQGAAMEIESQALCEVVETYLLSQPFSIALDCHSGYGRRDRIWFPYAGSCKPFPQLAEIQALKNLFDCSYPNHTYYKFEPQSLHYMTHGDLWDYLHIESLITQANTFLPLTLEMGSWLWVKKNPIQLFKFNSLFNPVLPHRHQRILRRHLVLIDFLLRAVEGYANWLPQAEVKQTLYAQGLKKWYGADDG